MCMPPAHIVNIIALTTTSSEPKNSLICLPREALGTHISPGFLQPLYVPRDGDSAARAGNKWLLQSGSIFSPDGRQLMEGTPGYNSTQLNSTKFSSGTQEETETGGEGMREGERNNCG